MRYITINKGCNYHITEGFNDAVVVPVYQWIGNLAFVRADALALYSKPEYKFLGEPNVLGEVNDYPFSQHDYTEVENPFAYWNKIKGAPAPH